MADIRPAQAAPLRDPCSSSERMRPLAAALRPLEIRWIRDSELCMVGTLAQARQAKLLDGRGMPGDSGCNKSSYTFRLDDGRRVQVRRSPGTDNVFVFVSKTSDEEHAERTTWHEQRRKEDAEREAGREAERQAQQERRQIPETYRDDLLFTLGMLRVVLRNGRLHPDASQWRLPARVRADVDKTIDQLERLFAATPLLPGCGAQRPSLSVVSGGRNG